ncbi:sensor histidine kinase [Lachnotalea glycerini]|uniref:histidine kinase n=1 Tax=Lachnotalea glycerini TaxID=1763509 RepID=A0A371J9G2_9FIRM|nr:HAMP domain-containing sensor histidine kinase [Lachnotalea glycerini]RDY29316.1 sensor histidine kinase [Lachnotalea glycerini]
MIYYICILLFVIVMILAVQLFLQKRNEKIFKVKLSNMVSEIQNGNLSIRMICKSNNAFSEFTYYMNEIVSECEKCLIQTRRIERAQKELLTGLSHDIKTPLTTLLGYLEIINRDKLEPQKRKDYLNIACNKTYLIKDYINNLFEWFQLSLKEDVLQISTYDINELTREIIVTWLPQCEKNNLELEVFIPDAAYCVKLDKGAYSRILNNLIQNVMMHSNATLLSIGIVKENNDINLTVYDNGEGIAPDKVTLIFDRLYQGHEYMNNDNGSGLGLAIVKELVENLNGRISVQSKIHEGTSFLIKWPEHYKSCL